ncbi:cytochrome c [bacterium]|nr:cytochrome c [candidate division CSSED10-310 bacterium]
MSWKNTSMAACVLMMGLCLGCGKGDEAKPPQMELLKSADSEPAARVSGGLPLMSENKKQTEKLMVSSISAEDLYKNRCAACHGAKLEGGTAPALDTVGARRGEGEILAFIVDGMLTMKPVPMPEEDAAQLARWLSHQR